MKGLKDTTAIVTGATGLIGTAITRRLLEEGATVIATSRSDEKGEEWAQKEGDAGNLTTTELDLSSAESIQSFCESCSDRKPTVLIANASCREGLSTPFDKLTHEHFRQMVDVDIAGHFLLARSLVDALPKEAGASIVFLSSIYAEHGVDPSLYPDGMAPTPVQYAVTKGGITSLTRYLAAQWGERNVRVNAIVGGGVRAVDRQPQEFVDSYSARTMLGRMANPEDIASAAAFLASQESSYMTGSCVTVDGGFTAW